MQLSAGRSGLAGLLRPASRWEAGLALFAATQTFVLLGQRDGFGVLLWWSADAWPIVLGLWLKDLALAAGAAFVSVALLRFTERAEGLSPAAGSRLLFASLAAVVAVVSGVVLRFVARDLIPPGLFADTLFAALPALRDPAGGWLQVGTFGEDAGTRMAVSPLPLAFVRAALPILGPGERGLVALGGIAGLLALGGVFLLARSVASARNALLAAALVALGRWPLVVARWAWCEALTIGAVSAGIAAGLAAFRRRSVPLALLASAALGAAAHGHPSGLPVGALLVGAGALHATRRRELRKVAAALLLPFALLVGLWTAIHLTRTGSAKGRYGSVALGTRTRRAELAHVPPHWKVPAELLFNLREYTGLPLWTGDPNPRMGIPNAPPLSPLLGAAALVGLVLYLRDASRGNLAGAAVGTLALGAILVGVLSNPDGAPNTLRASLLLPPLFLGAARALEAWMGAVEKLGLRRAVAGATLTGLLLAFEVTPALAVWPFRGDVAAGFRASQTEAGRLVSRLAPLPVVLDPAAVASPAVLEVVAARDTTGPVSKLPRKTPAELLAGPPTSRLWLVTSRAGARALREAGLRVSRPAGAEPVVVLVVP